MQSASPALALPARTATYARHDTNKRPTRKVTSKPDRCASNVPGKMPYYTVLPIDPPTVEGSATHKEPALAPTAGALTTHYNQQRRMTNKH
jgi:hypothetical protein